MVTHICLLTYSVHIYVYNVTKLLNFEIFTVLEAYIGPISQQCDSGMLAETRERVKRVNIKANCFVT